MFLMTDGSFSDSRLNAVKSLIVTLQNEILRFAQNDSRRFLPDGGATRLESA